MNKKYKLIVINNIVNIKSIILKLYKKRKEKRRERDLNPRFQRNGIFAENLAIPRNTRLCDRGLIIISKC